MGNYMRMEELEAEYFKRLKEEDSQEQEGIVVENTQEPIIEQGEA